MFPRLRDLVRALTARRAFEAGLTEELRFHIEQYTEDLVRSGVSPEEASRRARMELGAINTVKEECREARGLGAFDALERECRYAARQLWRNPGFTGTVVLTLSLAIGANTAIFSLVNALLLKDLPYAHPERIGTLYARTSGPQSSDARRTIDGEQWERLREDVPAAHRRFGDEDLRRERSGRFRCAICSCWPGLGTVFRRIRAPSGHRANFLGG
jgi:putative ABC transport system permease protein